MIYYSHINEDNRVERNILQQGCFPTIVAICGSGERVLSLMDNKECKQLYVVDHNPEALFLLQLKICALQRLSVEKYLRFIGHLTMNENVRLDSFFSLEKNLPPETRSYWLQHLSLIKKGVLHIGHFEKFLQRVRPLSNFWLGKKIQTVFDKCSYPEHFPSFRWKLLQKMFSYKIVYQIAGNRDAAFVGRNAQMEKIPSALNETFRKGTASSSFMAHLVFKGTLAQMQENELPPSLQSDVLLAIKKRLLNGDLTIKYFADDLQSFISKTVVAAYYPVFYSLSDILSFVDFDYLNAVLKKTASQKSCLVIRSFLRNRLSTEQLNRLNCYGEVSVHDEQETTGMYQVVCIKVLWKCQ
ncbi:MAG: DUF3419 family protein [Chitinophagaceae bacterium]|nr:MAG: DUF3419 family protein [Chitinophagaceae bacterium]